MAIKRVRPRVAVPPDLSKFSRRDFLKMGGTGLAGAALLGTAGCGSLFGGGQGGGGGRRSDELLLLLPAATSKMQQRAGLQQVWSQGKQQGVDAHALTLHPRRFEDEDEEG